jgi:serine phosphatase RsbU (regulator of sigma subunit)
MADIYLQKGDWINFIRYFSLPDLVHFVIYCFVVGGLCMMILYNLILFFNVKEPEYIYYVMCLFTSVIYITQRTSSGQVLGKIFGINGDIVVILLSLCFVLFIKSYTREVKNKTINTILSVLLIIYSWFCIDFIFFDRFLFKILYIVLIIPLSFTLIFVLWRSYNLGYKPAIYPLLASLLLAFANVIDVLANAYHLIPTHFLASISYELGLVQQSLLLSFGLSYKISVIRKENEKAQAENLRIVQEQNILLENKVKERTLQLQESNEEILQTNEELQQTLETINLQKVEIEEKNKHINDSIRYAQRIQKALLPFEENFAEHFGKDNFFILYKPKDVVSGDFYFFEEVDKKLIIMAVDCTGHGVPGAFMSMIGINLLEEIIVFQRNTNPAEILTLLHKKIRFVLKQKETKNTDGMDLSMVVINKDMQIMEFAGAKNPMIYLQNKELYTLKADKMPIGGEQKEMERIFTKQTVDISQPTTIYLFSDGYQDQFGGKNKKRFMISQMKELFLGLQDIPMLEQQNILNQTIDNWMAEGQETQIDDILVLGVKM